MHGTDTEGHELAEQYIEMRVGDVDVLVAAQQLPGTQPTSAGGAAGEKVLDAFEKAQEVIVGAATSTWETLRHLSTRAASPTHLEVEFALGYSVEGKVIVAGAKGEANLKVKLTYEGKQAPTESARSAT